MQNCYICKEKTSSSYLLWNLYYCKNKCWNYLHCTKCKKIIDKKRVYKGRAQDILCKDCVKTNTKMEEIKEETQIVSNTSSKSCDII